MSTVPNAELPGLGPCPRARHVVEDPADLRGREIGVQDEARPLADEVLHALRAQPVAEPGRPPVLPDDGVGTGRPFSWSHTTVVSRWLVMPTAATSRGRRRGLAEGFDRGRDLARPDLLGIVLDPAGLGKDLAELALGRRHRPAFAVEQDGARAGGPLIEGEHVIHWGASLQSVRRLRARLRLVSGPRGSTRHGESKVVSYFLRLDR